MLHRALFPSRNALFLALGLPILLLTGCSFLPSGGPSVERINLDASRTKDPDPYRLVTITTKVVLALEHSETLSSNSGLSTLASGASKDIRTENLFRVTGMAGLPIPPRQTVAIGDTVNVTIFEVGGGLFGPLVPGGTTASPAGTGVGTLPPQVVDESGQISVPFAGRLQAAGRTPFEIQQDIVEHLEKKAIEPQAIVTISGRNGGNLITVTGDVKTPSLIPVPPVGLRLLDALTAAGGTTGEPHETRVTVIRGSDSRTDMLADVLGDMKRNIPLEPADTVILQTRPWSYLAFGATGTTGTFPFGRPDLSLADAVATAGGAADNRAVPIIYLYRLEPTKYLKDLGVQPVDPKAALTPLIYQLDLRTPQSFFLAQKFAIRNRDILYFSNANSVGVLKFFGVVNALTAPARTGLGTATTITTDY